MQIVRIYLTNCHSCSSKLLSRNKQNKNTLCVLHALQFLRTGKDEQGLSIHVIFQRGRAFKSSSLAITWCIGCSGEAIQNCWETVREREREKVTHTTELHHSRHSHWKNLLPLENNFSEMMAEVMNKNTSFHFSLFWVFCNKFTFHFIFPFSFFRVFFFNPSISATNFCTYRKIDLEGPSLSPTDCRGWVGGYVRKVLLPIGHQAGGILVSHY